MQQSWASASTRSRRDPAAGGAALLRDERLGRRAPRATGRDAAREVGLRRRPRVLHARRRRCERERGEDRAPGLRQTARQDHHARPLLSRRELRDDGAVGRQPHASPGRPGSVRRRACAAAVCVSLSVRLRERRAMRRAHAAAHRRAHRRARRCTRRRRHDGAERRYERHRRAAQLLAAPAGAHARARRVSDRGRSHERLRALRGVVRLATYAAKTAAPI